MRPPPPIESQRLTLIPATATLARADANDDAGFAHLLGAEVPPDWPPRDLADVREMFAVKLEKGAAVPGWWHWYALRKAGGRAVLIGTAGFAGRPDDMGVATLGYGLLPAYQGRGYATEMAGALVDWAASTGEARCFLATTFERHYASVRVLEKNGFTCRGVSSEDAAVSEADRQGRGRLMRFVRDAA